MKVLIVVGAKKGGNTDQLVKQFAKGAASAGHDVEVEYLFGKDIHGCIDCQTCMRTGACVWKDDFPAMLDKVMAADVITFASPVYFFSISAQLKTFLDRTYAAYGKLNGKRIIFLSTAGGSSEKWMHELQKAVGTIEGWAICFDDMVFERSIGHWDMETTDDITATAAFAEAKAAGASL